MAAKGAGKGAGNEAAAEGLRALIQLAAAAVQTDLGNRRGRRKLLARADAALGRAEAAGPLPEWFRPRFEALAARLPS